MFKLQLVLRSHYSAINVHDALILDHSWHQRHGMMSPGLAEISPLGPLVLIPVIHENVPWIFLSTFQLSTCHASSVKIMRMFKMLHVWYCTQLTRYYEPSIVQSQASEFKSCWGQTGHQLPGAAPVLLQRLGSCQGLHMWQPTPTPPPCHNIHLQNECKLSIKYKHSQHSIRWSLPLSWILHMHVDIFHGWVREEIF